MNDYLNREEDKRRLLSIISAYQKNDKNVSFAINGKWGVGKSYFIKMLMEELRETNFVFYYDSWDNDYYDDPLIGMLDCLKDELNKINADEKALTVAIKKVTKKICGVITSFLDNIANSKIGFKPFASFKKAKDFLKECYTDSEISGDFNEYDKIKLAKHLIICSLNKLAETMPIIFIVDELDRCLPTYALKIIERIHHISENVGRCTTIFAVDTHQLEKIIDTLYHFKENDFNAKGYLRKVIDFTYDLGNGTISKEFHDCLKVYKSKFAVQTGWIGNNEINDFISILFENMEMRNIEKLINNAMNVHDLLLPNRPLELDMMCFELFIAWAISKYGNNYLQTIDNEIRHTKSDSEPIIKYLSTREDNYKIYFFDAGYELYRVPIIDLKSLIVYYVLNKTSNYYPSFNNAHKSIPSYLNDYVETFSDLIKKIQY